MEILIKSNSSYNYLWPIINDKTTHLKKLNVCVNDNLGFNFNDNITLLKYNQSDSYPVRLISLLEQINSDYVLLLHDVDIILNFDTKKIEDYLTVVKENKIDRLSLGVYNGSEKIEKDDIVICKLHKHMSRNFFTPFDYSPSIYNKKKLIDFYSNFKNETYRGLELNENAQNYISKNFNTFGIQKNPKIDLIYHRGFVFTKDFNFLHITVQGKFLNRESYFDLIGDFDEIKNKYNLNIESSNTSVQKNELF
jgi:hypothetical protein